MRFVWIMWRPNIASLFQSHFKQQILDVEVEKPMCLCPVKLGRVGAGGKGWADGCGMVWAGRWGQAQAGECRRAVCLMRFEDAGKTVGRQMEIPLCCKISDSVLRHRFPE